MSLKIAVGLLLFNIQWMFAQNKLIPVSQSFIYAENQGPTPECHASTLAATPDGIVVAWFGGTHEKNKDVGIWLSRLNGQGWSQPKEVVNGIIDADTRYPCWNPVLFKQDNGPLYLFYKVGPSPSEWWGMMMTSVDNGDQWSGPQRIPAPYLGPIKNKPVAVGSLLYCPSSTEHDGWKIHLELFDLSTQKWKALIPVGHEEKFDVIQPVLLTYPQNKIQLLNRSKNGAIIESWSNDNGHTWTALKPIDLPNPNSGIDGITLQNGYQLLIYNHAGTPAGKWGGDRYPLNISLSADGQEWKPAYLLENQPGEFSYPAVIQSADGMIHLCYTYNRKTIKYVKLKLEK
jgi:predicted neuraminidase